ncbi:hypothetical protein AB1N83_012139 [Pleurotus pulmonarius]
MWFASKDNLWLPFQLLSASFYTNSFLARTFVFLGHSIDCLVCWNRLCAGEWNKRATLTLCTPLSRNPQAITQHTKHPSSHYVDSIICNDGIVPSVADQFRKQAPQTSHRTMVDPTPNFDLYAPYFTGLTLTLAFYGVALAQSIFYFRVYREDKVYLKIVVVSLILLQSTQIVFTLISLLELTPRLGDETMDAIPRSFIKSEFPIFISTSIVQLAYTRRVWSLSANKPLVSAIILFSIIQLGTPLLACPSDVLIVRQFHLGSFTFMQKNIILRIVQLCSSTVCDLLIACSLVYLLRVNYQRVLSSTRNMIDTLIVICIGVGLVTSLFCILTIITWFAAKNGFWIPFHLLTASFYSNSFIASLNSRSMVRKRGLPNEANTLAEFALSDLRRT